LVAPLTDFSNELAMATGPLASQGPTSRGVVRQQTRSIRRPDFSFVSAHELSRTKCREGLLNQLQRFVEDGAVGEEAAVDKTKDRESGSGGRAADSGQRAVLDLSRYID
jgi:hypothetical protein